MPMAPLREPILSIVVPTRNREIAARSFIRAAYVATTEDSEVVVQDTGRDESLGAWIRAEGFADRVFYEHSGGGLSMTANWNRAAKRARGRVITFMGDDDGITSEVEPAARWMVDQSIDAVTPRDPGLIYFWPGTPSPLAGRLALRTYTGELSFVSPYEEFKRTNLGNERSPRVYQGLVSRRVFDDLARTRGTHFRGITPDLYSLYRFVLSVKRLALVDFPLLIAGTSPSSNHGMNMKTPDFSGHIREFADFEWPDILPAVETRSATPLIAQGFLLAIEDAGRPELVEDLDLPDLYVTAFRADARRIPTNVRRFVRAARRRGLFGGLNDSARLGQLLGARALAALCRRVAPAHAGDALRIIEGVGELETLVKVIDTELADVARRLPWATNGKSRRARPDADTATR